MLHLNLVSQSLLIVKEYCWILHLKCQDCLLRQSFCYLCQTPWIQVRLNNFLEGIFDLLSIILPGQLFASVKIINNQTMAVSVSLTFNSADQACEKDGIFIPSKSNSTVKVPSECLPLLEASGVMSGSTCIPYKPTSPLLYPPSLIVTGEPEPGCEILPLSRPLKGNPPKKQNYTRDKISSVEECCHNKLVDGKNYNLIGEASEKEMQDYGCNSPCVYNLEGDRQQQFCFRPGKMDSKCLTTSKLSTTNIYDLLKLFLFSTIFNHPVYHN